MNVYVKTIALALFFGAIGVVIFAIAYAGAYWHETGSYSVLKALDKDILFTLKMAWADVSVKHIYSRAALASGVSAIFIAALGTIAWRMQAKSNPDDARFLSQAEIIKMGLTKGQLFLGRIGGRVSRVLTKPYIDRATGMRKFTRPVLRGGRKFYMPLGDDLGGLIIGPPRSGKGAALIIPNCSVWKDSLVVLDMRGETYNATVGFRSTMSKVVVFSPAAEDGKTAFYNPLDFIRLDNAQRDIDIRNMAEAMFPLPLRGDPFWTKAAREFVQGMISYTLETSKIPTVEKHIPTVVRIISGIDQELTDFITTLIDEEGSSLSDYTRFNLSTVVRTITTAPKQFEGFYGAVKEVVAPFMNERIVRAISKSSFDIRNLKREKISLYLDFRKEQVLTLGPLFNVFITQLYNYLTTDVVRPGEHKVLFLLDEFQNLGKLDKVMDMASLGGGYGVATWFFVQSLTAIDDIYSVPGRKTLMNSAAVVMFFGAQDLGDLREFSELLGEETYEQIDVSRTQATLFDTHYAKTTSVREGRRRLMRPDQLRTLDKWKFIILLRNTQPIMSMRNHFFADNDFRKLANMPIANNAETKTVPNKGDAQKKITKAIAQPAMRGAVFNTEEAPEKAKPGSVFRTKTGRDPIVVHARPAKPTKAGTPKSVIDNQAVETVGDSVIPSPDVLPKIDMRKAAKKPLDPKLSAFMEKVTAALNPLADNAADKKVAAELTDSILSKLGDSLNA